MWLLALGLFVDSGVRNRDPWTVAGSVIFVVGIVLFLIPILRREGRISVAEELGSL